MNTNIRTSKREHYNIITAVSLCLKIERGEIYKRPESISRHENEMAEVKI